MYKLKKIVKVVDRYVFGGTIRQIYISYLEKIPKKFFNKKKSVIVREPVSDLILMQYNSNEYMQYQFYDVAVRMLAIKNYYGKNDYGFELYKKMHTLGGNYGQINETESYYKRRVHKGKIARYGVVKEQHSIEQFKKLINSYEKSGYDETSFIMADKNLLNMNGSHRIAIAVYNGQEFINVDIHNIDFKRRFSIDWFWANGFQKNEIDLIKEEMNNIKSICRDKIGSFYAILYPPAYDYFEDIICEFNDITDGDISVVSYKDYFLEKAELLGFLRTVYSFDSISEKNFHRKMMYILNASSPISGKYPIRIVEFNIKEILYRLKSDNGMPECINTVRLKEAIRSRYKLKDDKFSIMYEKDYKHDVIIHTTDNYYSNNAFRFIMNIDKDISKLFSILSNFEYCIVESSNDKISPIFPYDFYFNEDLDILVLENDLENISNIIVDFCEEHFQGEWISIQKIDSKYGKRIKIYLDKVELFMFDLMIDVPYLKKKALERIVNRNIETYYKHLSINDEITIRLCKYMDDKRKYWHSDFIKSNNGNYLFNDDDFDLPNRMRKIYESIVSDND